MEFAHFVRLIAIGLQARVPMHITGFPGVGKTDAAPLVALVDHEFDIDGAIGCRG